MKDISVLMILKIFVKRIWIIAIAAIIAAVATFVYCSNFVSPVYTASSSVIASNGGIINDGENPITSTGKISNSDVSASINILETCMDVMKTHSFYEDVAAERKIKKMDLSADDLQRMVTIERRSDFSLFIDIKVTCGDQDNAVEIANCIAETAPAYIQKMISDTYVVQADHSVAAEKIAPTPLRTAILVAALAAVLVVTVFVILAATDDSIKGEEDIVKRYNVAVLGIVPDFEPTQKKGAKK